MSWDLQLKLMNVKFGVTEKVQGMDLEMLREFWELRKKMLLEEMAELLDAKTADQAVDSIIDWIVFGIGTLETMGVDSSKAFNAVMAANMAKDAGVNPSRPNPFGLPDLVKPEGWVAPCHDGNLGRIGELFAQGAPG